MRMLDVLQIGSFGDYHIFAEYNYRFDLDKEIPEVEKIELLVRKLQASGSYETVQTIRLLDIPGWLWELLTEHKTLMQLKSGTQRPPKEDVDE